MDGVRTLVGTYDGTKEAAVMVNGLDDVAFGPLFTGFDAYDQIEAFREWMRRFQFISHAETIGLNSNDIPAPTVDPTDPRAWPESGLCKVVNYWKQEALDEHGDLKETVPT